MHGVWSLRDPIEINFDGTSLRIICKLQTSPHIAMKLDLLYITVYAQIIEHIITSTRKE